MVKVPSTIHDLASQQARQWILNNVYAGHENEKKPMISAETYRGLTAALTNSSAVLPIRAVTNLFTDCGYGPKKANTWINAWLDMGKVSMISYQGVPEYMAFKCAPLDEVDIEEMTIRVEEYRAQQQRKIDALDRLKGASA